MRKANIMKILDGCSEEIFNAIIEDIDLYKFIADDKLPAAIVKDLIKADLGDDENNFWESLSIDLFKEFDEDSWGRIMTDYSDKINLEDLLVEGEDYEIDENWLRAFIDKPGFDKVGSYLDLSTEFIIEFRDKLDWGAIMSRHSYSIDGNVDMEYLKELCDIASSHLSLGQAIDIITDNIEDIDIANELVYYIIDISR